MTPSELKSLSRLEALLAKLARQDPGMSVGELHAFLVVAGGQDEDVEMDGVAPGDIKSLGYNAASVTRFIQYWGDRFQTEIDPRDRRYRRVRLSPKGKEFARELTALMDPRLKRRTSPKR